MYDLYPAPPPTQVRNIEILTQGIWLWNWLPPVFPSSVRVRPADMDGWVEQGGQILMLDGCVYNSRPPDKPSAAVRHAVTSSGNLTYLALATDTDGYDEEAHLPRYVTHYALWNAAAWNPPAYQWRRPWTPLAPRDTSLWQVSAIVAQWAAWAHYHDHEAAS